jgi:hypothetical protein
MVDIHNSPVYHNFEKLRGRKMKMTVWAKKIESKVP